MHGRVTGVSRIVLGDEATVGKIVGSTEVTVDDGTDFDEDGGHVLIGGTVYEYLSVEYVGDAADEGDPAVLTLAAPLVDPLAEGGRIDVWDATLGEVAVEYVATLVSDSADVPGDPLEADVDHHLVPLLAEGIRATGSESVEVERDGDDLRVVNVLGKSAEVVDTIITGGVHRTAEDGQRMEMYQDDEGGRIDAHYSVTGSTPGFMNPVVDDAPAWLDSVGWRMNSGTSPDWPVAARLRLMSGYPSADLMPKLDLIETACAVGGYLTVQDFSLLYGDVSIVGAGLTVDGTVELNDLDGTGGLSYVMVGNDGLLSRGDTKSSLQGQIDALEARIAALEATEHTH